MTILTFIGGAIDASRPRLGVDPYTDGLATGAVPFLFDLLKDYEASHADAAYLNAHTITDLSDTGDGSIVVVSGQTVASATPLGGADFSALTVDGSYIAAPAGALNAIRFGTQAFGVCLYVLMPKWADFNQNATLAPFFVTTDGASGYATPEVDMVTIAQLYSSSLRQITARRQTNGGATAQATSVTLPDYSTVTGSTGANEQPLAQIGFYRGSDGVDHLSFRYAVLADMKNAATTGSVAASSTASADNSGDFSAKVAKFGVPLSFWDFAVAEHVTASNFQLLRGFVRNLEISAPASFATELDADWTRVANRVAALLA